MPKSTRRRPLHVVLVALAAAFATCPASAQPSAREPGPSDRGDGKEQADRSPARAFRGSVFSWDHSATTQTFGVGDDYQSANPTYEMTFRLAPRYFLFDDAGRRLALRADARLVREFTDSDRTTRRGEWTFADTELWLEGSQTLGPEATRTTLIGRAPILVLPTSKFSAMAGRVLGLGFGGGLDQVVPLRGPGALLPRLVLRPRANYTYQFASSVVAVNDRIDRLRIDADGRALSSDQLSGSALPQHQLSLSTRVDTHFSEELLLSLDFGLRAARRYALAEQIDVCGNVATGCADVRLRADASRWAVATVFVATVGYSITDYVEVSVGYANLALQLGEDGQRRSFFYSPAARGFVAVGVTLDGLYDRLNGSATPEASRSASATTPAWYRFQ